MGISQLIAQILIQMAPMSLYKVFSPSPSIINSYQSVCIESAEKHNKAKKYANIYG